MDHDGTPPHLWLAERGAQKDLVSWAERAGDAWSVIIDACPRGDWLLAIAAQAGATPRELAPVARTCAALGRDYLPDDAPRAEAALLAIDRWVEGRGDADAAEHAAARAGAERLAEEANDPSFQSAALALVAALDAIEDPSAASAAASLVARAAALDAGECGVDSALRYTHAVCADLARPVARRSVLRST